MGRLANIVNVITGTGYLHTDGEKQDVWVDSLPTIAPGDTNTNPIYKRTNEDNCIEYYRKHEDS